MPVNQRQKIMILGDDDRKRKSSFYKLYCGRGKDFAAAIGSWHISRRGKKKKQAVIANHLCQVQQANDVLALTCFSPPLATRP